MSKRVNSTTKSPATATFGDSNPKDNMLIVSVDNQTFVKEFGEDDFIPTKDTWYRKLQRKLKKMPTVISVQDSKPSEFRRK